MKKICVIAVAAMVMAACGESGLEERASVNGNASVNDNAGAEALLQVRTRTGDETTVSYPVQVYVFQSDECRAVQTIGDAGQALNITLGGATKTYTYSTTDELAAGYRISIDGTYTEAIGVNLTGTITGAAWLGQRTISFTFDESGSAAVNGGGGSDNAGEGAENNDNAGGNNNDNQDNQDNFPAVGGTYGGCYVLAVDVADGGQSAELTILSPNEQAVTSAADVDTKLPTLGSGGISGWDVPTSAQLKLVEAQKSAIANAAEGKYYLYRNADGSKYYYHRLGIAPDNQSFGSAIGGPWPDSFEILLRPVAVVTVAAE